MSDDEDELAGEAGSTFNEGGEGSPTTLDRSDLAKDATPDKRLSFEEASRCLNTLGKDETGMRYAYINISATERMLTDVSVILSFKHILFVDVSDNFLTFEALEILTEMPFLILLKADGNRINTAKFEKMAYLQVLIFLLYTFSLFFTDNQIYLSQFESDRLSHLKQLELKGNFLTDLSGTYPANLEKLYVAENRIRDVKPSSPHTFRNLTTLHLRENYIRKLNGFTSDFINLRYLNLRKNKITKFRQFRKLKCLPKLETLIILGNPFYGNFRKCKQGKIMGEAEEVECGRECSGDDRGNVQRDKVVPLLVLLPMLKRINKALVTIEEREQVEEIREEKLEEIMGEETTAKDPEKHPDPECRRGNQQLACCGQEGGPQMTNIDCPYGSNFL
ncbi:hypothetical protein RI129_013016 [Pyrocoelia pectoralis]|uniref:Uncharacterized protein n=1 Tax=Pyrocoelia pectoralis TaxID=417401 RepID=A0AAN7ZFJ6_9COLE